MPKKIKKKHKAFDKSLHLSIAIFSTVLLILGFILCLNLNHQVCANSVSCIKDISGKKSSENIGIYMGQKVTSPNLPDNPELAIEKAKNVLGNSTGDVKHIYVSLKTQRLYAYQGSNLVFSFPISSGKWHQTPTGDFRIWVWLRYTEMVGGDPSKGTYYDLPNVPYTMYFANNSVPQNKGYSLHGAYWHNNFGHPMSHGCINLPIPDAQQLYYWTDPSAGSVSYPTADNPGTLITIYGNPPANEVNFID